MSWRQVPPAIEPRTRVPIFLPWLLAVLPLRGVLHTFGFGDRSLLQVAVVLGATAVALRVWPAGLPAYLVLATIALAAVTDQNLGWHLTVIAVVPLGFWMIALGSSDLPYRWLPDGRLFRPCLVPIVLAAAALVIQDVPWVAQRLVAVACVVAVIVVILPGPVERVVDSVEYRMRPATALLAAMERLLAGVGRQIGRAMGVIVMLPVSVVVMIAWTCQRLVAFDPFVVPTAGAGRWVRRAGADPEPQRLFSSSSMFAPGTSGFAPRRVAAAALTAATVLALLAATIPGIHHLTQSLNDSLGQPVPFIDSRCVAAPDPAMDGDPGWPRTLCDTAEYSVNGRFSAVTTYTMADHESETVNVHHGVRDTWMAPECDCRRVRMWMFGGSAAFGWWQRDDLTIASQLAQLAWNEGIALDVELRANPGWVLGQELRLFNELSVTEAHLPNIALFYDGGNELQRQRFRNESGRGDDESPTSYAEDDIDRLLRDGPFPWYAGEQLDGNDSGSGSGSGLLPGDEVARHAMNRYIRELELARRSTRAAGVEAVFVWQPLLVTSGRQAGNPGALGDADWDLYDEMLDEALQMIPEGVVDMSDVLGEVEHPVFKDLFHHNVEASRIIAEALLEELRPRLQAIADE